MNITTLHSSWWYVWKCQNILFWPLALFFPQSFSVCLNHYKNLRLLLHTGLGPTCCFAFSLPHNVFLAFTSVLLWYYWLFAFWFVCLICLFCFSYSNEQLVWLHTEWPYIYTGLMGFWLIPVDRRLLGQAAGISGFNFLACTHCWNKHSHQLPVAADERCHIWVYVFSN